MDYQKGLVLPGYRLVGYNTKKSSWGLFIFAVYTSKKSANPRKWYMEKYLLHGERIIKILADHLAVYNSLADATSVPGWVFCSN